MELLKMDTGVDIVHVPYKGSAPAVTDVMAGQVSMLFDPMPSSLPFIKTGKLHALTVSSSKRSPLLPQVPSTIEAGVPGYDYLSWLSFVAPAGTPREVIAFWDERLARLMKTEQWKKMLAQHGWADAFADSAQFKRELEAEREITGKLLRELGFAKLAK